jgi:hypothetical protein
MCLVVLRSPMRVWLTRDTVDRAFEIVSSSSVPCVAIGIRLAVVPIRKQVRIVHKKTRGQDNPPAIN